MGVGVGCCGNKAIEEKTTDNDENIISKYSKKILIKENYEMLTIIGSGSFGKVRLYRSNICKKLKFAVKTLKKEGIERPLFNCFKNEINILRCVDHPNIVNFIESYENEGFIHVVTEYLKGKDLQNLIRYRDERNYEEKDICYIIKQILVALKYLHEHKIVHRDLKPENLIFGDENSYNNLKIIDFGLSTFVGAHDRKSCGSPYYMAPELIDGNFDPKSDVWSVGIILYQMLTGKYPFEKEDNFNLLQIIQHKELDLTLVKNHPDKYSKECINLLTKLLIKDVDKRPSSSEALEHEWFKKFTESSAEKLEEKSKFSKNMKVEDNTDFIIKALKNFASKNIFQKEILYFLSRMSDDDEIEPFKKIFLHADKKCYGFITYEEFIEALNLKKNVEDEGTGLEIAEYESLFNEICFHKKDKLSFTEFIASIIPIKRFDNDRVSVAYKYFEEGGKKTYVTPESFIRGIEAYGLKPNSPEIIEFFSRQHLEEDRMNMDNFIYLFRKEEAVQMRSNISTKPNNY